MLGGGTFTSQNKVLPGSYINFISKNNANAELSERGIATMPLVLDWGKDGAIFEVTNEDFQKNSMKIFGYDYTHEKLKGLRDLFLNVQKLYAYRLNSGAKASNEFASAIHSGLRGNDLKIVIKANVDDDTKFDVSLYLGTIEVDAQTVAGASELIDNDYVEWNKESTLSVNAGIALSGGTNGEVSGASHQAYLDKVESYAFNVMGIDTTEETIKTLYTNFVKRMRDNVGSKFQLVVYNKPADYEGVINVKNKVLDFGASEASLVYWVVGVQAGCEVNKSVLNRKYDGEFEVDCDYTQTELELAIKAGEFALHNVGADVRVLSDINSLVTTTEEKGDIFKENQTIRVIDQIANDIATLFNTKYLGIVPNDESGRISLWADIVKHHEQLQEMRAIENFSDADVKVAQGETKKAVVVSDTVTIVNAMGQLYMTVKVA